ncbi:MAG: autotransporter outer membrane beta-barrel domain-containing protein, partial [Allosphingosinicella sp.]
WLRGYGDWSKRDSESSTTLFNQTVTHDLSYRQDIWGIQGGFDQVSRNVDSRGGLVMFGLTAGYVRSDLEFDARDSEARFSGFNLGGYMTYVTGRFFADVLVKADLLKLDYDSGIAGIVRDDADVRNYGVRLDTGYRIGNRGFFIDPQATLEYVYTEMDELVVPGTTVVSQGRSLWGRLGARAGTTIDMGGIRLEPSIMPSVWHLLDGDNDVRFFSGAETARLTDDRHRTYGEVSGILNMFGTGASNLSGFVKADYRFGTNMSGYGVRAGLRLGF